MRLMPATPREVNLAQVLSSRGELRFRYQRVRGASGDWVRHGMFVAYHDNGRVAQEGVYEDGAETGTWRDFHQNGQLASEGPYERGREHGLWRFWDEDGALQATLVYAFGVEIC